jgi:TonB family protein
MAMTRPVFLAALVLLHVATATAAHAAAPASDNSPATVPASAVRCGPIEYPLEGVRYGLEGTAQIEYSFAADGSTKEVTVKRSSGWRILDDASIDVVTSCKAAMNVSDTAARHVTDYRWSLNAPASRQRLVPNSCAPSDRFAGFMAKDLTKSGADGILVRALVRATGEPHYVRAERGTVAAELANAAVTYLRTCKFVLPPGEEGPMDEVIIGRVMLK